MHHEMYKALADSIKAVPESELKGLAKNTA